MTETPPPPPGEPVDPAAEPTVPAEPAYADPVGEPPAASRGSRRGVVIGSVAAVLAVVAGVAVYATTALSGGGRQPDELVPKAAFAFAKIDLDPAANQKLAARRFFDKLPGLKEGGGGGDSDNPFDGLLKEAFSGSGLEYDRDVKPWFDKRAAIAAFPGGSGAEVVAVFRSKDDGKARKALDAAAREAQSDGHTLAYKLTKGYAVVGEQQAAVDDAIRLSGQASLRENTTYRKDVDRLTGDQVAVAWVDAQPAFQAVKDKLPFPIPLPPNVTDLVKGRLVSGLHLTGDYAEVEGLTLDLPQQTVPKQGDPALLKSLPASTVAAVSLNGLRESVKEQLDALSGGGLFDPEALAAHFLGEAGLTLKDDVLPLLGDQTVLALGDRFQGFESLRAALVSHVDNPTKAASSGPKVAALLAGLGVPAQAGVKPPNTFVLATGDYLDEIKSGSGLGTSPKFTKAMGDLSSATAAAYVDVETFMGDDLDPKLRGAKSIGFVSGLRDRDQYFRIRFVVG